MSAAREQGRAAAIRRGALAVLIAAVVLAPTRLAAPVAAAPLAGSTPISVSVVVPITASAGENGLLDPEALAIATGPSGALTRELEVVLATSATIALDPLIPASIRVLGATAPPSATAWLDRLAAAPNEVFLTAYADADLSALARTGALDLAEPLGFGFALDPSAFGPAVAAEPTESATPVAEPAEPPEPGATDLPPLPTTQELLAWPDAIGRIAWPSAGSVVSTDIAAYGSAGYDAVLLSSANASETSGALADLGGVRALIAESAASDLLREASTSIDDETRDQAIARLGIALDGLAAAHPGRSAVLTLDRSPAFSLYGFDEAFAAIAGRDSTRMTELSTVLGAAAEPATVVDAPAADHIVAAADLVAAVRAEEAFATILSDPLLLTAPRRLQLLALLAVQDVGEPGWAAAAGVFSARSAEILASVSIVDTGSVFVASSSTSIPIRIANSLDVAVRVRIDARPLRPLLQIDSPVDVTVEPSSSKTVRLEAQAITNGRVIVRVALSSPSTGTPIGNPRDFDADLQAQWETVGLIVGGFVALVFATGIVRNVVVRRAGRKRAIAGERDAG